MYNFSYLQDSDFLHEFDRNRNKEQLIKITILDWKNESPLEEITGSVIDGNISIDGSSAMRRTANISLLLNDYDYNLEDINNIISINKKVEIMIGFVNNTNKYTNYPVLWFPQGIYLIISASITHDLNGIKASLTLHDKMALLNGECGGIIPAATVFNEIENEDDYGNISKEYPTIVQIIQQLVNHFGKEQLGKIIIKDLQPIVKQVLKWNGESGSHLYIYDDPNNKTIDISTLSYDIYKNIFIKCYRECYPNSTKDDSELEEQFTTIMHCERIPELKTILNKLLSLQKTIENKSNKIEEWKDNLKKLQDILNSQNFSLIDDIKKEIENLRIVLNNLETKTKDALGESYSKHFEKQQENFTIKGEQQFKGNASLFTVGMPQQLYYKIIDFKKHCSLLENYCTTKATREEAYLIFSLIMLLECPKEKKDRPPSFEIPQYKVWSSEKKKYITITPPYKISVKIDETGYYRYPVVYKVYKNNDTVINTIINISPKVSFEENSMDLKYLSNEVFRTTMINAYSFLTKWLQIREEVYKYSFYSEADGLKQKEAIIFSYLSQYIKYYKNDNYNNIDDSAYLLRYFQVWCDELLEVIELLKDKEVQLLADAKNIRDDLLNNCLTRVSNTEKNAEKDTNSQKIEYPLYDFLNIHLNKIENLINILPIKKTTTITKDKQKITITVQFRQEAKKLFSDFKNDILNKFYKALEDLNFQTYIMHTETEEHQQSAHFTILFQCFHGLFEQHRNDIEQEILNKSLFTDYNGTKIKTKLLIDYNDTEIEKDNHNIINNSLQTIKKYYNFIDTYKQSFASQTLLQLQDWLDSTTFETENPSNVNLSTLKSIFNSINKNIKKEMTFSKTTKEDDPITTKLDFTDSTETKDIEINTKYLNKIITQLQPYINSNVQNQSTELSLSEQIAQYKKELLQILQFENDAFIKKQLTHFEESFKSQYSERKRLKENIEKNSLSTRQKTQNYPYQGQTNLPVGAVVDFLNKIKNIQIFQVGEDVGYTLTDFTYPGSLTAAAGETVTSILDKIKNTLGNYQYFYDINGNFIFQQVRNYLNKSYSTYMLEENASSSFNLNNTNGKYIYNFNDGEIIQSYSNNVNYQDIKNDFIVWGQRKTVDGKKYPIRYHLAIDTKPAVESVYFIPAEKNLIKTYLSVSDFPIEGDKKIYYYALQENEFYEWIPTGEYNEEDKWIPTEGYKNSTFFGYKKRNIKIKKCDSKEPEKGKYSKDTYYYQINQNKELSVKYSKNGNTPQICNYPCFYVNDYRTELYLDGVLNEPLGLYSNEYYTELKTEWPKLFNFNQGVYYSFVKKNPDNIDYYLDLLSTNNLTSQYGISLIGKRTQIITNNSINCIFQPTCPDYVFNISKEKEDINKMINKNQSKTDQDKEKTELLLKRAKVNNYFNQWNEKNLLSQFSKKIDVKYDIYKNFANGGTTRSAYEEIRSVLYQYLTYNEQISLTTIPIYYLQPNNLIQVNDAKSNISGSYLVKNISLPLGGNGTMTMNCSKAIEKV